MTTPEKLHTIQHLSGLSQTALAQQLGVSFVAFNRWITGKAVPRKGAQERIDALYRAITGLTVIPEDALAAKKTVLMRKAAGATSVVRTITDHPDIRDQFALVLTYTSNSIEGSTLTQEETAAVLFQNVALPDKSLTEHLEAKNHQAAFLFLLEHVAAHHAVDEALMLKLHGMLMNGIRPDAGAYRSHAVRIVGADIATANHLSVPKRMAELAADVAHLAQDIAHIAAVHARFEQIHPFSDGNGRIGRLLMHAMLLQNNLPPVVIRPEKKRFYYAALNTAQKRDDTTLLQDFLCDGILEGWGILEREEK